MTTDTLTLARALDALARDIQSDDGAANAAIAEAAQRLRDLHRALADAISTYTSDEERVFVSAERQEAWIEALK